LNDVDPTTHALLALDAPNNLYPTVAWHPDFVQSWRPLVRMLKDRGLIDLRTRELLLLRVGWHCRAEYVWTKHVLISKEIGMSDEEIERVALGPDADGWSAEDRVILRAVDELYGTSRFSDATWAALRERFAEPELVEVCGLVGGYQLLAYLTNGLGIGLEPGIDAVPFSSDANGDHARER